MTWHKGDGEKMSRSQRDRYNRKHRLRYLERELRKGRVPSLHFKPDLKVLELYKMYQADEATTMPMHHLTQERWQRIKAAERKLLAIEKEKFRNEFPADMDPKEFTRLWKKARPIVTRVIMKQIANTIRKETNKPPKGLDPIQQLLWQYENEKRLD